MKIAVVRGTDVNVRAPDELLGAVAAGHEVVDPASCEVLVVALVAGERGPAVAMPWVAMIARGERGYDEADRSSVEANADALVLGAHGLADAIAWVASEDRAARTVGPPRLTVIGTSHGDFGNSRTLTAEPTIIGRSMAFGQHPQRPDRMPTPTGSIARHHAQLRWIDGVVSVRDLRSTNGTLVIRHGEPARLLCPQEQSGSGHQFGPAASPWLTRDPSGDWVEIRIGDHLQMPGFWRFRIDGDPTWSAED